MLDFAEFFCGEAAVTKALRAAGVPVSFSFKDLKATAFVTCMLMSEAGFRGEAFDLKLDASYDFLAAAGFAPGSQRT